MPKCFKFSEQACLMGHYMGCVNASRMCKLGEGTEAEVMEVTADGEVRALKVGSFDACCDEAAVLLHANHPRTHPHVLQVSFVHSPSDGALIGRNPAVRRAWRPRGPV